VAILDTRRGRALLAVGNSIGALVCGIAFFAIHNLAVRVIVAVLALGFAASAGWLQHRITRDPIVGPRGASRPD
jgi:hypothetical protein